MSWRCSHGHDIVDVRGYFYKKHWEPKEVDIKIKNKKQGGITSAERRKRRKIKEEYNALLDKHLQWLVIDMLRKVLID